MYVVASTRTQRGRLEMINESGQEQYAQQGQEDVSYLQALAPDAAGGQAAAVSRWSYTPGCLRSPSETCIGRIASCLVCCGHLQGSARPDPAAAVELFTTALVSAKEAASMKRRLMI